jgi:DDE superfamily endonuclease
MTALDMRRHRRLVSHRLHRRGVRRCLRHRPYRQHGRAVRRISTLLLIIHLSGVLRAEHGFDGLNPDADGGRDADRRGHDPGLAARTRPPLLLPRALKHRRSIDRVSLVPARLIVALLVGPDAPLIVAIDDSANRRSGKKVPGAFWQYDGSTTGAKKTTCSTCYVVGGIVAHLPSLPRALCLPVLARLYLTDGPGEVPITVEVTGSLASIFPQRRIHVVADAVYHGKRLRALPENVRWTCRTASRATPSCTNCRPLATAAGGAAPPKGERLGQGAELATTHS